METIYDDLFSIYSVENAKYVFSGIKKLNLKGL